MLAQLLALHVHRPVIGNIKAASLFYLVSDNAVSTEQTYYRITDDDNSNNNNDNKVQNKDIREEVEAKF